MRRYLFHLGVFHLQIHHTKVSAAGCCLAASSWLRLEDIKYLDILMLTGVVEGEQ